MISLAFYCIISQGTTNCTVVQSTHSEPDINDDVPARKDLREDVHHYMCDSAKYMLVHSVETQLPDLPGP
jgi:hypothetical protein